MTSSSAYQNRFRVALMGIYHESNTFIETQTTLEDFRSGHLLCGQHIADEYADAFHEIGGMLEYCRNNGIEVVPVLYAEATPGGIIRRADYEEIRDRMLDELKKLGLLDGCLVVPHGAGVAEGYDDMDGDWLMRVREIMGDTPIVGTLDPHANISQQMAQATDTLIAYSTNPHIDQRETGIKAARRLAEILRSRQRPAQVVAHTGLAISIEQQMTAAFPCSVIYERAAGLEQQPGIFSISIVLGFPYADVPDMGTSVIVTGRDTVSAEQTAGILVAQIREMRDQFVGTKTGIAEALSLCENKSGPVLLLDMGDNVGGGSPGDSTILLTHIENSSSLRCLTCIYDPDTVKYLSSAANDSRVLVRIGGAHAQYGLTKFENLVQKVCSGDGKFSEDQPRHGGQVSYDMGEIAIVTTSKGNTVLLMSKRIPPFSMRQVTTFGINPVAYDVIVAKGVNAPVAAYREVCPFFIQVDTPGFTQADMTRFFYRKRRVPLFPFE